MRSIVLHSRTCGHKMTVQFYYASSTQLNEVGESKVREAKSEEAQILSRGRDSRKDKRAPSQVEISRQ